MQHSEGAFDTHIELHNTFSDFLFNRGRETAVVVVHLTRRSSIGRVAGLVGAARNCVEAIEGDLDQRTTAASREVVVRAGLLIIIIVVFWKHVDRLNRIVCCSRAVLRLPCSSAGGSDRVAAGPAHEC